jgi:hypothetical protein
MEIAQNSEMMQIELVAETIIILHGDGVMLKKVLCRCASD